jgi:uncharacterized protein YbcV (DUF1398 family)
VGSAEYKEIHYYIIMENIKIHKEGDLYCLNDIAEKIINSTNVKEFVKKIKDKKLVNSNYYITYEAMINLLNKSKSITAKKYLEYLNNKNIETLVQHDKKINKYSTSKEDLNKKVLDRKFVDFGTNNIRCGSISYTNNILFIK